jgi:hypothetical protein
METASLIQLISSGVGACCKIAPHSALRSGFDSPVVFDSTRTEAVQRPPAAGTVCTATLDWIAVHFFAKFRPPLGRCHTQDRPARSRGLPSLAGRRPASIRVGRAGRQERGQLLPEPSAFQSPAPKSSLTAMWDRALILLCHKMRRCVWCWQHGQRRIVRAMAFAMVIRTEVIEVGTWRSGRIGGSAGSITVG